MLQYKMDPLESVAVEIRADTPSVFRFIAQKRVPGRDYRDFAASSDWGRDSLSRYFFELLPPIRTYTDLRIYFLMDAPAGRPTRISVSISQSGQPLGDPIVCQGRIDSDGSMVFSTAEATLVTNESTLI
ncbi:MAG: hypothetical protein M3365_02655 [Gemmatimonadota bacterium]|nr:hypothetical protein [Gemmatimonadota bacterium]